MKLDSEKMFTFSDPNDLAAEDESCSQEDCPSSVNRCLIRKSLDTIFTITKVTSYDK